MQCVTRVYIELFSVRMKYNRKVNCEKVLCNTHAHKSGHKHMAMTLTRKALVALGPRRAGREIRHVRRPSCAYMLRRRLGISREPPPTAAPQRQTNEHTRKMFVLLRARAAWPSTRQSRHSHCMLVFLAATLRSYKHNRTHTHARIVDISSSG